MTTDNAVAAPTMIYGTAWKEEATAELTQTAVLCGFRAIDTANQRKHYREDLVGVALARVAEQGIARSSLFLQTKFTYVYGQDHRVPYDPTADFASQVRSSFQSSLDHLHTDFVDSYLLHGPISSAGWTDDDWEAWSAFESLHESGQARMIGVSNVGIHHLTELTENARIKPMVVQNRCYAQLGWDRVVREFCRTNGIQYQGFSLLTANMHLFGHPTLATIAKRLDATQPQVVFRFCQQLGIVPLTGTTNELHIRDALRVNSLDLNPAEMDAIASVRR